MRTPWGWEPWSAVTPTTQRRDDHGAVERDRAGTPMHRRQSRQRSELLHADRESTTARHLPLTASFSGSANFAGSTTAQTTTLTVLAQQPTTTKLALSPSATVLVGNELAETFSATVTPATNGTPTGIVSVSTVSTPLCSFFLANGTGSCHLTSASKLPPGIYPLTATYAGDGTFAGSTDTSQTLTVTKIPTVTTGASLPASRRGALRARDSIPPSPYESTAELDVECRPVVGLVRVVVAVQRQHVGVWDVGELVLPQASLHEDILNILEPNARLHRRTHVHQV